MAILYFLFRKLVRSLDKFQELFKSCTVGRIPEDFLNLWIGQFWYVLCSTRALFRSRIGCGGLRCPVTRAHICENNTFDKKDGDSMYSIKVTVVYSALCFNYLSHLFTSSRKKVGHAFFICVCLPLKYISPKRINIRGSASDVWLNIRTAKNNCLLH